MQRSLKWIAMLFGMMLLSSALYAENYVPPPEAAIAARAGYARVFVYRTRGSTGQYGFGYGVAPKILIEGKVVTALRQDQFTVVFLKPGHYSLNTASGGFFQGYPKLKGELIVAADKTYYLKSYGDVFVPQEAISNTEKSSTRDGWWYNAFVLNPANVGTEEISRCAYVAPLVRVYE